MSQHTQSPANANARANGRALGRVVEQIYRERCYGLQIEMTRISELFTLARTALRQGEDCTKVGDRMVDFINSPDSPTLPE